MKFLKQLSLYTFVGIMSAGISFFVMPVLSHYLSPADYGLLSLFNTYVIILSPLISISANGLLSIEYFKQKDKARFASQFSSIQLIPLFNALLVCLLVGISFNEVSDVLELSGVGIKWGYVIVLLSLFAIYYEQFIQLLILQKNAKAFAFFSLARVIIEVALTFYFIVGKGWNWEGRIYSWLIVTALFVIIAFIYFYRTGLVKGPVQLVYIKEGLSFGAPLVFHSVGKFVVNQSDRLFIVKMVSLEEAGKYNIGYTVGMLVMIAINAFFNFSTPYLMERLAAINETGRLQVVKLSYYYILGAVGLLLGVYLFAPILFTYFIDPRYADGVKYVFWVALGYCFWGGYMFFSAFIFYLKKSRILGFLAFFNIGTNLVFNYIFIQSFGAIGAAYATALSFFLIMVLVAFISHRLMPMPWHRFASARAVSLT
jgi:O-antigen/teichoic acid export membrane protein